MTASLPDSIVPDQQVVHQSTEPASRPLGLVQQLRELLRGKLGITGGKDLECVVENRQRSTKLVGSRRQHLLPTSIDLRVLRDVLDDIHRVLVALIVDKHGAVHLQVDRTPGRVRNTAVRIDRRRGVAQMRHKRQEFPNAASVQPRGSAQKRSCRCIEARDAAGH